MTDKKHWRADWNEREEKEIRGMADFFRRQGATERMAWDRAELEFARMFSRNEQRRMKPHA